VAGGAGLGAKLASLGLAGKLMVGTAVVATTSVGVYEATTRVAPAFRAPTVATVATAVAVDAPKGVAKGGERTPDAVPSVAAPAVPGAEAEPQAATTPAAAPSAVPSGALSRVPGAAGAGTEKGANDKSGTESVLAQEIALVREAQAALAAGDATTALGKLAGSHRARWAKNARRRRCLRYAAADARPKARPRPDASWSSTRPHRWRRAYGQHAKSDHFSSRNRAALATHGALGSGHTRRCRQTLSWRM
jgi:hypothetical protein